MPSPLEWSYRAVSRGGVSWLDSAAKYQPPVALDFTRTRMDQGREQVATYFPSLKSKIRGKFSCDNRRSPPKLPEDKFSATNCKTKKKRVTATERPDAFETG